MKYLFAFRDTATCESFCRALDTAGIVCDIRTAHEFPDGTQGPELWVRDEDYEEAKSLISDFQRES